MALTTPGGSTTEDIEEVCRQVGIPLERAWDLVILDNLIDMDIKADLVSGLNLIGYYDEKADQLMAAGMSFV